MDKQLTMTSRPADRIQRKLLGAWYTPLAIVRPLIDWAIRSPDEIVLDPSSGDGSFLSEAALRFRGLASKLSSLSLIGVDINVAASEMTGAALRDLGINGSSSKIIHCDFFRLDPPDKMGSRIPLVDAIVGNPPYVRFQLFSGLNRDRALRRAREAGVELSALSSSWAPFVAHATMFLKAGGRLALVLPEELVHAGYAAPIRRYLRNNFRSTSILRFHHHLFPESQERVVLLLAEGKGESPGGLLRLAGIDSPQDLGNIANAFIDADSFGPNEEPAKWESRFDDSATLLLRRLESAGWFVPLRSIGKAGIGYVSGANKYFVLRPSQANDHGFPSNVLRPTIVAARQVPGARLTSRDFANLKMRDENCFLWSGGGETRKSVRNYIRAGVRLGISRRYKCRQRDPWYIVPGVHVPDAFLTYMSDFAPRFVLNEARAACSNNLLAIRLDNIPWRDRRAFGAAFYNSATLLSAERIGRRYGGGVLKLEPSEADRLLVPSPAWLSLAPRLPESLSQVDRLLRSRRELEAIALIDELVLRTVGRLTKTEIETLRESRDRRRRGRMDATSQKPLEEKNIQAPSFEAEDVPTAV